MAGSSGSFKPGQSGNPSGRPKKNREVAALFKKDSVWAYRKLKAIIRDKNQPGSVRVQALSEFLNRGLGKVPQALNISGTIEQHIVALVHSLDDPKPDRPEAIDVDAEEVDEPKRLNGSDATP